MIKAKVIGASGYGGIGIVELLLHHPNAQIETLVALESVGRPLSELYPHLTGFCDKVVLAPDEPEAQKPADIVFLSTPDGVGMKAARTELERGAKVIDYSGDFRFNHPDAYADYATRIGRDPNHADPELLLEAVYGVPELHREKITPERRLVANPGCFAVSCILGFAPVVKTGAVRLNSLICDCKSGVSGAGKKVNPNFHYPARYEMMNAYRLSGHQHVCEIERELGLLAGEEVPVTFTAQVLPICRGIMSCLYADLLSPQSEAQLLELYRDFFAGNRFVRIYPSDAAVGSLHVRGTNYINLVISVDERTQRLRVVAYIDNLVKGQAGSALQNMNLLFGLPEETGLDHVGIYP